MDPSQIAALMLGAIASWCDLRTRRIPNLVTFGGAALGVAHALYSHGAGGMLTSVGGWLTGIAVFVPLFVLGGMGAGDVKLLGGIGAWLGPLTVLSVALYAALAGGVLALVVALRAGYLGQARRNLWLLLMHWRVVGLRPLPELTLNRSDGPRLPYAVPIAAGAVVAIWLKGH